MPGWWGLGEEGAGVRFDFGALPVGFHALAGHFKVVGVNLATHKRMAQREGCNGSAAAAHVRVEDGQARQRAHFVDAPAHEFYRLLADVDAGKACCAKAVTALYLLRWMV